MKANQLSVLLLVLLLALLAGCATRNGRRYPVVGFGWVTVSTNQPAVAISSVLGMNSAMGQFSLGLSRFTAIRVPTNANVVISLRK